MNIKLLTQTILQEIDDSFELFKEIKEEFSYLSPKDKIYAINLTLNPFSRTFFWRYFKFGLKQIPSNYTGIASIEDDPSKYYSNGKEVNVPDHIIYNNGVKSFETTINYLKRYEKIKNFQ